MVYFAFIRFLDSRYFRKLLLSLYPLLVSFRCSSISLIAISEPRSDQLRKNTVIIICLNLIILSLTTIKEHLPSRVSPFTKPKPA